MHRHNISLEQLLARVRSLQSHRPVRDHSRRFWIEGVRQFVQVSDAGWSFDTILYSKRLLTSAIARMITRRLSAGGVRCVCVSPEQFRSISITERASGIGATVRQRWTSLHRADPVRGLCWLVIESIRSPGNLGTILRTAEATGAAGAIFLTSRCDPFDPAVVRASRGGIFHLRLIRATHAQLRQWAKEQRVHCIGLSPRAGRLWTDLPSTGPFAIVLGEERRGLSREAAGLAEVAVELPMPGHADSLNVSVAAGVMLYELLRRETSRTIALHSMSGVLPSANISKGEVHGSSSPDF